MKLTSHAVRGLAAVIACTAVALPAGAMASAGPVAITPADPVAITPAAPVAITPAGLVAAKGLAASGARPARPVTAYVEGSPGVTPIDTATNTAGQAIKVGTSPRAIAIMP